MTKWLRLLSLTAALSLVAAACGGGDEVPEVPEEPGQEVLACQVTDVGGIDDRSFNQTAFAGVERARDELGVEIAFLESQQSTDYEPNIAAFVERGCDIIVTVGFLIGDATKAAAEANPDQKFAIVDFAYDPVIDNVLGLTFATDQAAFLAGYLAAGVSKTGKIGTYGGIQLPTVTIFMDGLWAGVAYHNEQKGTKAEVLGWDPTKETGLFTGDFEDAAKGRSTTEDLISQGADIILPVAGPAGLGTTAAVEDSREDDAVIWVDVDGCVTAESFCPLFITSIEKHMDVAVFEAIAAAVDGTFEGGTYVGTLENEGVGIAPFHEFEDDVPDELAQELDAIRQGIIDGDISVDPQDYS